MQVEYGSKIRLEYTGKLLNGQVFDSNKNKSPLQFTIGDGSVLPGITAQLIGMNKGQEKTFTLDPNQAYGMPDPQKIIKIPLDQIPKDVTPQIGRTFILQSKDGKKYAGLITAMNVDGITLDLNFPLAGKSVIFTVKILDIIE